MRQDEQLVMLCEREIRMLMKSLVTHVALLNRGLPSGGTGKETPENTERMLLYDKLNELPLVKGSTRYGGK